MKDSDIKSLVLTELYEEKDCEIDLSNMNLCGDSKGRKDVISPNSVPNPATA